MSRPELSTGEALVGLLESYGVDTIFGIPGVHNVEMYRALPRSSIRHILPRHEQGAGFMADGYFRATGKPGVCFTITGPGLTNIMTPLAQAWSDSSAILVISSALDIVDSAQGRGRLHEMRKQREAAASAVELDMVAFTPADVRDCIAQAFSTFAGARPRPAYLELPLDMLKQPAGSGWIVRGLPSRPIPASAGCSSAAELLAGARRPLLIIGGGAVEAGASVTAIAERLGAPILTTIAGKGIVRADHPLCLGARMPHAESKRLMRDADVILAVGTEISETDLWDASIELPGKVIRVDIDPASLARPHGAAVAILGDAKPALDAILEALPAEAAADRRRASEQAVVRQLEAEPGRDDDLRRLLRNVLTVIRESLPEDTICVCDSTQIAYAANEIFPIDEPRTWHYPSGFGTLGFALPAAIGAKAGRPDTPVTVLVGDYGLQYTMNELGTAAELRQPLVILLWNNDELAHIRDDMVQKGIQPNAVTLVNPDFQMLAKAYRCRAEKPDNLGALAGAIKAALAADRPTLIEMTPQIVR
jgi:thiamine pyrophosphate-dependent acetolactate synthase large subunit-like protein